MAIKKKQKKQQYHPIQLTEYRGKLKKIDWINFLKILCIFEHADICLQLISEQIVTLSP